VPPANFRQDSARSSTACGQVMTSCDRAREFPSDEGGGRRRGMSFRTGKRLEEGRMLIRWDGVGCQCRGCLSLGIRNEAGTCGCARLSFTRVSRDALAARSPESRLNSDSVDGRSRPQSSSSCRRTHLGALQTLPGLVPSPPSGRPPLPD
jgi:hypothetical protein